MLLPLAFILVAVDYHQRNPTRAMDDDRVAQFTELLIARHGADAEKFALQRSQRCLRQGETKWAELYREVAAELARRRPPQPL